MGRESAFLIVLLIILTVSLSSAIEVQSAKASGTIYIRANGSIDPPTANMTTSDNVTYVFTDNIFDSTVVVEKNDIVVDGAGYTLQGMMHLRESTIGINLSGRTNVTVRNMQIRIFSVGIFLSGSSNNTLSGNNMTDCAYGISLSSSTGNSISGNSITGNDFYGDGFCGIWVDSSSYNSIGGNYVANNSNCGISVVGFSNYNSLSANNMTENVVGILLGSSNNSISGNMFTGDGLLVGSYSNSVENNTVNGKPLVYLTDVKDYSVGEAGQVILVNCDNIKVENLDLSGTSTGVQLLGTNNTIISGNNMTANFYGILLGRSSNNSLSGNSFASCESCIHLDGSFGNYICENNMTASTNGITLSTSSNYNIVSENTIANNQHGIWLGDSSYNSVTRNNITANSGDGIFLDGASNNSVSVNNLVDNDFGIYLYLALDNIICHNNFENARQVIAESEYLYANVWDDGYPSGGNYWSHYNGTDLFNGLYQNETGSDNIGDTSYVIYANNVDNYPLMRPHVSFENQTIYIRADGNVDPTGAPIQRNGDVYTLTGNITSDTDGIVVERNNIVIDGNGYAVQGNNNTTVRGNGLNLTDINNVTIKNTVIENFQNGIWLYSSSNNSITENNITNNVVVGIELILNSIYNSISGNTIANNGYYGISLQSDRRVLDSTDNTVFHNDFINNTVEVKSWTSERANFWDNGCEGNYWSAYNGTDLDNDGVGDTYLPWEGVDNYPLMNVYRSPCDINHDLEVNRTDIDISANAFGTRSGDSLWNPHADITGPGQLVSDGKVDMRDIGLIARHFGEHYS
jgi:parallel beta-helix repeat protein